MVTMTDAVLVKILIAVLVAVLSLVGVLIRIMHGQILKRLDSIDADMKPLITEVTVQSVEIKNIKTEHTVIWSKLNFLLKTP